MGRDAPKFDRNWLLIDRNALDEEIATFPDLFHACSIAVTIAQSVRDEAKDEMDRVAAELDPEIRQKMHKKGEKDTNEKVRSKIMSHRDYVGARDEMRNAERGLVEAQANKDSMQQKSYMLRGMIDLYSANYYSTDLGAGARRVTDETVRGRKATMAEDARKKSKRGRKRQKVE